MKKLLKTVFVVLVFFFAAAAFLTAQSEDEIIIEIVPEDETEPGTDQDAAEKEGEAAGDGSGTDTYELDKVTIVDLREPTTSVVTGEEIDKHDDRALNETLERVPGIISGKSAKGHDRITMRGYETQMIGIVIDGVPVHDLYMTNLDFSLFPVFGSTEVRILRGPVSAIYGTDAAVGLVEVKSGHPRDLTVKTGFSIDPINLDFRISGFHQNVIGPFYYQIGAAYYNEKGYTTPSSLTTSVRRQWVETLINTEVYGSSYTDLLGTSTEVFDYITEADLWNDTFSKGVHLAGKLGGFLGDNSELGASFAFNDNDKKSLSFTRDFLNEYNPATETWLAPTLNDALITRPFEWPLFRDWYVTPYFEYQGRIVSVSANAYYRQLQNSLVFQGNISHWFEITFGGRVDTEINIAPWNTLTVAVFGRNDTHLEEEETYTDKPSAPLTYYIGVRPPEDEVPDRVAVKDLAGIQAALAIEERLTFGRFDITLAASYDFQYYYKSLGERGTWVEVSDGNWQYNLGQNPISSEDAFLLGTRDAINPTARVEISLIEDKLVFVTSGSIKTKFPTFEHYYADFNLPGADEQVQELASQVSYNANAGIEISPLPEKLSFRVDGFFTSYDNKIESFWDSDTGEFKYFNIDSAYSTGAEAVARFAFAEEERFSLLGTLGYTFAIGIRNAYSYPRFEYLPAHEVLADMEASVRYGRFGTLFWYGAAFPPAPWRTSWTGRPP